MYAVQTYSLKIQHNYCQKALLRFRILSMSVNYLHLVVQFKLQLLYSIDDCLWNTLLVSSIDAFSMNWLILKDQNKIAFISVLVASLISNCHCPRPGKEGSKINGCLGGKFLLLFSWPGSKNLSLHSLEKGEIQYSLVSSVQWLASWVRSHS